MAGERYHDIQQTRFEWWVPVDGYRWLDVPRKLLDGSGKPSSKRPPVLLPVETMEQKIEGSWKVYLYEPLEDEPTLFQEFADVEPTREGILAFINNYGLIAGNLRVHEDGGRLVAQTDSFDECVREITEMQKVRDIWCAIQSARGKDVASSGSTDADSVASLKKSIRFKGGVFADHLIETDDRQFHRIVEHDGWGSVDIVSAASGLVGACINAKLTDKAVSPQLIPGEDGEFSPYLVPENLLSAMWLQLYLWVAGDRNYRRCPVCGFWADTTGLRSDWTEHQECGSRRRAKKSYERRKAAKSKNKKGR